MNNSLAEPHDSGRYKTRSDVSNAGVTRADMDVNMWLNLGDFDAWAIAVGNARR